MKKQQPVELTLRQQALAHGFQSLVELAARAGVTENCIYFANQGKVPKSAEVESIAKAMSTGPRPGSFSVEDVLRAVDAGSALAAHRVREEIAG